MRIVFALPGLHRVPRGAEVAFESIAHELALAGGDDVLLLGSGERRDDRAYRFEHVPAIPRERFEHLPRVPLLRSEYAYEELTFAAAMALRYRSDGVDVTVTCSYPYTNWVLRSHLPGRPRPAHVFVTQNGDWPAYSNSAEYRLFSCDGLVCTNPSLFERNRARWQCSLIPNGVDPARFHPGPAQRESLGLPADRPIVLIVSALVEAKRVLEGIRAVARLPEPFLLIAGDGPLREKVERLAEELLPGRFKRRAFPHAQMPNLYRSVDVFLHPGLNESFGNVYVEALATGLPVVANDVEGTRWIFGPHGHLVDATSSEALAEGVREALRVGKQGADDRAAFAASRYAWTHIAARYRTFFQEVSAGASPGAHP